METPRLRYLIPAVPDLLARISPTAILAADPECEVTLLDDLSTGRYRNIAHLENHPRVKLLIGSVLNESLLEQRFATSGPIFHLASAVGVKLILERPVHSIETIVKGTNSVLNLASRYRKPVLIASTSEVYGKSTALPFREEGDQVMGATDKQRWAYASAKALEEFLALAHWRETRLPVIIARLFNTVGPRQTGRYGMVLPTFVRQALSGKPLTVYGDGQQARCFCHVHDVVDALAKLMKTPEARGEVINIGTDHEVTILQLAQRVKDLLKSTSEIRIVPYDEAYVDGFEDMHRRVPFLGKAQRLIGYKPEKNLDDCILDAAALVREEE